LAAALCGILLGGVSAWFLGSVAVAGLSAAALSFNFHIPAAIVRLLAVGRTAARYGERLVGHRAALGDQVAHRLALFASMAAAPAVRRMGWQFGDQDRLADYLDDVEDVDYARLRAGLPILTLAIGFAGLLVASAILAPLSLLPIASISLAALLVVRRMKDIGTMDWRRTRKQRRAGAERLGAAMASALALKAERAWNSVCGDAFEAFGQADKDALALRRRQSGLDMVGSALAPVSGASVIAAAWLAGIRGDGLLPAVFLAFAWLAFGELLNGPSRLLVAALRRDAAQAEIGRWEKAIPAEDASSRHGHSPAILDHAGLSRRSPTGAPLSSRPLPLHLQAGQPTFLVGTSGSGKTSLLKQIAGWIGDDVFSCGEDLLGPDDRRVLTMLSLHDAAILDDTVRANLFASSADDAALWKALEAVEMAGRIRQAGGLNAWIRSDQFSLGEAQRLNLARAWLSDRPIILLDEPSEHLDDDQGQAILKRLLAHLCGRIVVISTHRIAGRNANAVIELES
jgi:ABC-type transport system involved in cytochrome bd biosynthesis fused ATPase/permease subunit